MTREDLVTFLRDHPLAVIATSNGARPEAALVGIAVTGNCELVFDTSRDSRKCANLQLNPRVAVVVGWDDEVSVQIEGQARIPEGDGRERCLAAYFAAYPDGRKRAESGNIVHYVIAPAWVRYSDFGGDAPRIEELRF